MHIYIYIYMYMNMCVYIYMYIHTCVCMYVRTNVCMYVCMCVYISLSLYIYIYIHTHTHIHTYIVFIRYIQHFILIFAPGLASLVRLRGLREAAGLQVGRSTRKVPVKTHKHRTGPMSADPICPFPNIILRRLPTKARIERERESRKSDARRCNRQRFVILRRPRLQEQVAARPLLVRPGHLMIILIVVLY